MGHCLSQQYIKIQKYHKAYKPLDDNHYLIYNIIVFLDQTWLRNLH